MQALISSSTYDLSPLNWSAPIFFQSFPWALIPSTSFAQLSPDQQKPFFALKYSWFKLLSGRQISGPESTFLIDLAQVWQSISAVFCIIIYKLKQKIINHAAFSLIFCFDVCRVFPQIKTFISYAIFPEIFKDAFSSYLLHLTLISLFIAYASFTFSIFSSSIFQTSFPSWPTYSFHLHSHPLLSISLLVPKFHLSNQFPITDLHLHRQWLVQPQFLLYFYQTRVQLHFLKHSLHLYFQFFSLFISFPILSVFHHLIKHPIGQARPSSVTCPFSQPLVAQRSGLGRYIFSESLGTSPFSSICLPCPGHRSQPSFPSTSPDPCKAYPSQTAIRTDSSHLCYQDEQEHRISCFTSLISLQQPLTIYYITEFECPHRIKNSSLIMQQFGMAHQIIEPDSISQFLSISPQKIPLRVQIATNEFTIKPQYPDTEMHLIEILIRMARPDIPKGQKLYFVNWTPGPMIGKAVEPTETVAGLLKNSKESQPIIRVFWDNCPKFRIEVYIQDVLIFFYTELKIFHYMADLFDSIDKDVRRMLKLGSEYRFGLKIVSGMPKKFQRLAFVGRYFDIRQPINKVQMVIDFQQALNIEFVKKNCKINHEQLICPVTHLVMQEPVETVCGHIFDRMSLLMAILTYHKCPLCRHGLNRKKFKCERKLKKEIDRLIQLQLKENAEQKEDKEECKEQNQSDREDIKAKM